MITLRPGSLNDKAAIAAILNACGLPSADIDDHLPNFIVAMKDGSIVGCAGFEAYGKDGLLRSVAVEQAHRHSGIASSIYDKLVPLAWDKGIRRFHLLTSTATGYFERKGFRISHRDGSPEPIRQTNEFTELCPSSAVYMVKEL